MDNRAAQIIIKEPVLSERTKHISVRWHFVRDLAASGVVWFPHCPTNVMVADVLTKALPHDQHVRLCELMHVGKV